ncbi:hypothetical protein ACWGID_41355 [Kribbella sp. NPDC054772]
MPDQGDITEYDAALHAQLRLFCQLMLGSTDAADCMLQQIYHQQEDLPSDRVHLFRVAAGLCGVRR